MFTVNCPGEQQGEQGFQYDGGHDSHQHNLVELVTVQCHHVLANGQDLFVAGHHQVAYVVDGEEDTKN